MLEHGLTPEWHATIFSKKTQIFRGHRPISTKKAFFFDPVLRSHCPRKNFSPEFSLQGQSDLKTILNGGDFVWQGHFRWQAVYKYITDVTSLGTGVPAPIVFDGFNMRTKELPGLENSAGATLFSFKGVNMDPESWVLYSKESGSAKLNASHCLIGRKIGPCMHVVNYLRFLSPKQVYMY